MFSSLCRLTLQIYSTVTLHCHHHSLCITCSSGLRRLPGDDRKRPALLGFFFFFQAEDGIRDKLVTGVQTCALPISLLSTPLGRVKVVQIAGAVARRIVPYVAGGEPAIKGVRMGLIRLGSRCDLLVPPGSVRWTVRSEEHTSELQSLAYLVCRLLLEK